MRCPACLTAIRPGSERCSACGSALPSFGAPPADVRSEPRPLDQLLTCAVCGAELRAGEAECSSCYPTGWADRDPAPTPPEFERRLARARRWMVIGIFVFGWLFAPIAVLEAGTLLRAYRFAGADDPVLRRRIVKTYAIAWFLTAVFWIPTAVYLLDREW